MTAEARQTPPRARSSSPRSGASRERLSGRRGRVDRLGRKTQTASATARREKWPPPREGPAPSPRQCKGREPRGTQNSAYQPHVARDTGLRKPRGPVAFLESESVLKADSGGRSSKLAGGVNPPAGETSQDDSEHHNCNGESDDQDAHHAQDLSSLNLAPQIPSRTSILLQTAAAARHDDCRDS